MDTRPEIYKKESGNFSFVDTAADLAMNREFVQGFLEMKSGKSSENTVVWEALSAVGNDISQVLYENVLNYVQNTADVNTCAVQAVCSMSRMLGTENYSVMDELSKLPRGILRLLDIFSVKREYLIDRNVLEAFAKSDFTSAAKARLAEYATQVNAINQATTLIPNAQTSASLSGIAADAQWKETVSAVFAAEISSKLYMPYSEKENDTIFENLAVHLTDVRWEEFTYDFLDDKYKDEVNALKMELNVKGSFNPFAEATEAYYSGKDFESDSGPEKTLVNKVLECRARQKYTYTGKNKGKYETKRPETKYAWYKERELFDYMYFVHSQFASISAQNLLTYDFDPIYNEISANGTHANSYTIAIPLDSEIAKTAQMLARIAFAVADIREQLKVQGQKNYLRGTFVLISYLINRYLSKNIPLRYDELSAFGELSNKFGIGPFKEDKLDKTSDVKIQLQEYEDNTEYYNLSASSTRNAGGRGVNARFWELETEEAEIPFSEIDDFYLQTLKLKYSVSADLYGKQNPRDFLDVVYGIGADESYLDPDNPTVVVPGVIANADSAAKAEQDVDHAEDYYLISALQRNTYLSYTGNAIGFNPSMNFKNKTHSSYQVHPYLWKFTEYNGLKSAIENAYYNSANEDMVKILATPAIDEHIGKYGTNMNVWKDDFFDFTGYKSRYENGWHSEQNGLLEHYDGLWYPDAIEEYVSAAGNDSDDGMKALLYSVFTKTTTNDLFGTFTGTELGYSAPAEMSVFTELGYEDQDTLYLSAMYPAVSAWSVSAVDARISVDAALSAYDPEDEEKVRKLAEAQNHLSAVESLKPETFYEKWYKAGVSKDEAEYIAKQLLTYKQDLFDIYTDGIIDNDENSRKYYDVYKYGLDKYGNSILLYKQYENGLSATFSEKRNTPGRLWIKKNAHPIGFPAFDDYSPEFYLSTSFPQVRLSSMNSTMNPTLAEFLDPPKIYPYKIATVDENLMTLYAIVKLNEYADENVLAKSTDGGKHWTRLDTGENVFWTDIEVQRYKISDECRELVYAVNTGNTYAKYDSGTDMLSVFDFPVAEPSMLQNRYKTVAVSCDNENYQANLFVHDGRTVYCCNQENAITSVDIGTETLSSAEQYSIPTIGDVALRNSELYVLKNTYFNNHTPQYMTKMRIIDVNRPFDRLSASVNEQGSPYRNDLISKLTDDGDIPRITAIDFANGSNEIPGQTGFVVCSNRLKIFDIIANKLNIRENDNSVFFDYAKTSKAVFGGDYSGLIPLFTTANDKCMQIVEANITNDSLNTKPFNIGEVPNFTKIKQYSGNEFIAMQGNKLYYAKYDEIANEFRDIKELFAVSGNKAGYGAHVYKFEYDGNVVISPPDGSTSNIKEIEILGFDILLSRNEIYCTFNDVVSNTSAYNNGRHIYKLSYDNVNKKILNCQYVTKTPFSEYDNLFIKCIAVADAQIPKLYASIAQQTAAYNENNGIYEYDESNAWTRVTNDIIATVPAITASADVNGETYVYVVSGNRPGVNNIRRLHKNANNDWDSTVFDVFGNNSSTTFRIISLDCDKTGRIICYCVTTADSKNNSVYVSKDYGNNFNIAKIPNANAIAISETNRNNIVVYAYNNSDKTASLNSVSNIRSYNFPVYKSVDYGKTWTTRSPVIKSKYRVWYDFDITNSYKYMTLAAKPEEFDLVDNYADSVVFLLEPHENVSEYDEERFEYKYSYTLESYDKTNRSNDIIQKENNEQLSDAKFAGFGEMEQNNIVAIYTKYNDEKTELRNYACIYPEKDCYETFESVINLSAYSKYIDDYPNITVNCNGGGEGDGRLYTAIALNYDLSGDLETKLDGTYATYAGKNTNISAGTDTDVEEISAATYGRCDYLECARDYDVNEYGEPVDAGDESSADALSAAILLVEQPLIPVQNQTAVTKYKLYNLNSDASYMALYPGVSGLTRTWAVDLYENPREPKSIELLGHKHKTISADVDSYMHSLLSDGTILTNVDPETIINAAYRVHEHYVSSDYMQLHSNGELVSDTEVLNWQVALSSEGSFTVTQENMSKYNVAVYNKMRGSVFPVYSGPLSGISVQSALTYISSQTKADQYFLDHGTLLYGVELTGTPNIFGLQAGGKNVAATETNAFFNISSISVNVLGSGSDTLSLDFNFYKLHALSSYPLNADAVFLAIYDKSLAEYEDYHYFLPHPESWPYNSPYDTSGSREGGPGMIGGGYPPAEVPEDPSSAGKPMSALYSFDDIPQISSGSLTFKTNEESDIYNVKYPPTLLDTELYKVFAAVNSSTTKLCSVFDLSNTYIFEIEKPKYMAGLLSGDIKIQIYAPTKTHPFIRNECLSGARLRSDSAEISVYKRTDSDSGIVDVLAELSANMMPPPEAGYTAYEVKEEDLKDFLKIYACWYKAEDDGIYLYFNYNNLFHSPYVYRRDSGLFCTCYKPETYLKLGPGESGLLNVVTQLQYIDGYGEIRGAKDLPVLSYKIWNVSDDKPKFVIKNQWVVDDASLETIRGEEAGEDFGNFVLKINSVGPIKGATNDFTLTENFTTPALHEFSTTFSLQAKTEEGKESKSSNAMAAVHSIAFDLIYDVFDEHVKFIRGGTIYSNRNGKTHINTAAAAFDEDTKQDVATGSNMLVFNLLAGAPVSEERPHEKKIWLDAINPVITLKNGSKISGEDRIEIIPGCVSFMFNTPQRSQKLLAKEHTNTNNFTGYIFTENNVPVRVYGKTGQAN